MTFAMSDMNGNGTKVIIEDDEEGDEDCQGMTLKEIEEQKKKEKELQQKKDDIALVVCMLCLLALTTVVVIFKVSVIDSKPDPNVTTFSPMNQQVKSNIRYNGNGYIPCNGYVPCQPVYLPVDKLEERLDGAMPCHNYRGQGDTPAGCW